MKQKDIFIAFFRSGILGFGGGPSAIPLVQREVVDLYKWMDDDEFSDVLSLANALPGPINTKMAGYIGLKVGGVIGMINALFATVIPTVVLMIVFLTSLNLYKDKPWVAGMSKGVIPVVGVLMGILAWDFVKKSKGYFGWTIAIILMAACYLLMETYVHPAILIVVFIGAAFIPSKKRKMGEEK